MIQKTAHRRAAENAEEEDLFSLAGERPSREKGLPHTSIHPNVSLCFPASQRKAQKSQTQRPQRLRGENGCELA
jgi:hypothetical protein